MAPAKIHQDFEKDNAGDWEDSTVAPSTTNVGPSAQQTINNLAATGAALISLAPEFQQQQGTPAADASSLQSRGAYNPGTDRPRPPPGFGYSPPGFGNPPPGPGNPRLQNYTELRAAQTSVPQAHESSAIPQDSSVLVDLTPEPQTPEAHLGNTSRDGRPSSSFSNPNLSGNRHVQPGTPGARGRTNTFGARQNSQTSGANSGPSVNGTESHASSQDPRVGGGQLRAYNTASGRYIKPDRRVSEENERPRINGQSFPGQFRERSAKSFASPEGLVTTRKLVHKRETELSELEKNKYVIQAAGNEEYPATGYYMWPSYTEKPMEVFGFKLEDLNVIRTSFKVWIEWIEASRCLKISSKSVDRDNQGEAIKKAIDGIRGVMKSVNARDKLAHALHLSYAPSSMTMRAFVGPVEIVSGQSPAPPQLTRGFIMNGDPMTEDAAKEWDLSQPQNHNGEIMDNKWTQRVKATCDKFEKHAKEHLKALETDKKWMRMRLHFGHVELNSCMKEFREGTLAYDKFEEMLAHKRTEGDLNKNLGDGMLAIELHDECQTRVDETTNNKWFSPANGQIRLLEDVKFKEKVILHVTLGNGDKFRIEAAVDKIEEGDEVEYQMGEMKVYRDSKKKLMVVRMIDIESKLDYALEVISDGEKRMGHISEHLLDIMRNCFSKRIRRTTDWLGLFHPVVKPQSTADVMIDMTEVRSMIQYMKTRSGYIVEIGVYRKWLGTDTSQPLKIDVRVSMWHHNWDTAMYDMEDQPQGREWTKDLSELFPGGFHFFHEEVRIISWLIQVALAKATGSGL